MRKIWAEQLRIEEHLTQKQWYWAMGLDDIPKPPTWPTETWPRVKPLWHKMILERVLMLGLNATHFC